VLRSENKYSKDLFGIEGLALGGNHLSFQKRGYHHIRITYHYLVKHLMGLVGMAVVKLMTGLGDQSNRLFDAARSSNRRYEGKSGKTEAF
jgi:hypothetical protein